MSFDSTKVVSTDYLKAIAAWTGMELQRLQSSKPSLVFTNLESEYGKSYKSKRSSSSKTTKIMIEKLHPNLNGHYDIDHSNAATEDLMKKKRDNRGDSENKLHFKNSLKSANKAKINICSISNNHETREKGFNKKQINLRFLNGKQSYSKTDYNIDKAENLLPVCRPKKLSKLLNRSDYIKKYNCKSKIKRAVNNPEKTLKNYQKIKTFPCSPRSSLVKCMNPVVSIVPMSKERQSAISINPKPNKFLICKNKNTFEYKYPYTSEEEEESEKNLADNSNEIAYLEKESENAEIEIVFEDKVDMPSHTEFVSLKETDIQNLANGNHYHFSMPEEYFDLAKFTNRLEQRFEEVFNTFPVKNLGTNKMLQSPKINKLISQTSFINFCDKSSSPENCPKIHGAESSFVNYQDKTDPSLSKKIIVPLKDVPTSNVSSIKQAFQISTRINENYNKHFDSSIEHNFQKDNDNNGSFNLAKFYNEGIDGVITIEKMEESKKESHCFNIEVPALNTINTTLSPDIDIAETPNLNIAPCPPISSINSLLPDRVKVENLKNIPSQSPIISFSSSIIAPSSSIIASSCPVNALATENLPMENFNSTCSYKINLPTTTANNVQSSDLICAFPSSATRVLSSNDISALDLNSTPFCEFNAIPDGVQSLNLNCTPPSYSNKAPPSPDEVLDIDFTCATSNEIRAESPENALDLSCISSLHPFSELSIVSEKSAVSIDRPNLTNMSTMDKPPICIDTNGTLNNMLVCKQSVETDPFVKSNGKEIKLSLSTDTVCNESEHIIHNSENLSICNEKNYPAANGVKMTENNTKLEESTSREIDMPPLTCSALISHKSLGSYTMSNLSNTEMSPGEICISLLFEDGDVTISEGEIEFEASLTSDIPSQHNSSVASKDNKRIPWSSQHFSLNMESCQAACITSSTQTDFENKVAYLDEDVKDSETLNTESITIGETVSSGELILEPGKIMKLPESDEIRQLMEENLKLRNKLSCFSGRFCLEYVRDTG